MRGDPNSSSSLSHVDLRAGKTTGHFVRRLPSRFENDPRRPLGRRPTTDDLFVFVDAGDQMH